MISVFFYGSFMDDAVRATHGWAPRPATVATLDGYELRIDPLSRLVRREGATSWGVVCEATQEELDELYSARWMDRYHPVPVTVVTRDGERVATLVYLPDGPVADADVSPGYVEILRSVAERLGFPESYRRQIESSP